MPSVKTILFATALLFSSAVTSQRDYNIDTEAIPLATKGTSLIPSALFPNLNHTNTAQKNGVAPNKQLVPSSASKQTTTHSPPSPTTVTPQH